LKVCTKKEKNLSPSASLRRFPWYFLPKLAKKGRAEDFVALSFHLKTNFYDNNGMEKQIAKKEENFQTIFKYRIFSIVRNSILAFKTE
jgi:hypothetical protein